MRAGKCVTQSDRRQLSPEVPGQRPSWTLVSSYPVMLSYTLHPRSSLSLLPIPPSLPGTALFPFDHIRAKTRGAIFREEWCFFICPRLFVAQKSTEGFLTADVSSAALQRAGLGGVVRKEWRTEQDGMAKGGCGGGGRRAVGGGRRKSDGVRHTAEDLDEASAEREGLYPSAGAYLPNSLCTCLTPPAPPFLIPSLPVHTAARTDGRKRAVGMRSPLRGGWISGGTPTLPGLE